MKNSRRVIISGLVLIGVLLLVSQQGYCCCVDPDATMTASDNPVCIGCSVTFDASNSSDDDCASCGSCNSNGIRKFEWDFNCPGAFSSDHSESPGDGKATHTYSTAKVYKVKVNVWDDDNSCCCSGSGCEDHNDVYTITSLRVVEVNDIVENGTSDKGPLYECVGGSVTLKANPNPSGSFPTGEPHWTVQSQPTGASATLNPASGSSTTTLGDLTKAGNYGIRAKCGSIDTGDTITVTVVGVSSISQDKTKACVCEAITFTAHPTVSGKALDCIEWQKQYRAESSDAWGSWGSASGGDPNAILSTSVTGQYQYQARNGTVATWTTSSIVSVIKVDKVKIKNPSGTYDDVTGGTVVVLKGSGYTFKAYPSPSGVSWPSGEPRWSCLVL